MQEVGAYHDRLQQQAPADGAIEVLAVQNSRTPLHSNQGIDGGFAATEPSPAHHR